MKHLFITVIALIASTAEAVFEPVQEFENEFDGANIYLSRSVSSSPWSFIVVRCSPDQWGGWQAVNIAVNGSTFEGDVFVEFKLDDKKPFIVTEFTGHDNIGIERHFDRSSIERKNFIFLLETISRASMLSIRIFDVNNRPVIIEHSTEGLSEALADLVEKCSL